MNWNISQNTYVKDYQKVLEQIKTDKGLTDESPLFQREYLGRIVYDLDSLVFRLEDANYFTLPEMQQWVNSQPVTDIRFSGGLDYGFEDADGVAIIMFSTSKPERFLVYEYMQNRLGVDELAEALKKGVAYVETAFPTIPNKSFSYYADTAGGVKKISHEFITRYGLYIKDAYKAQRDLQIEFLQEEVRKRTFKVKKGGAFDEEARKTVFSRNDKDELTRQIDDATFHPNLADAVRYGFGFITQNYK
jgi:hypothetical protein